MLSNRAGEQVPLYPVTRDEPSFNLLSNETPLSTINNSSGEILE